MKKLLFVMVLLAVAVSFTMAQSYVSTPGGGQMLRAWNFQTYTNYVATTDDTTGFINLPNWKGLNNARELYIGIVATDSVNATATLQTYNLDVSTTAIALAAGTKEIELGVNGGPALVFWTIKSPTVDLLAGATSFKLQVIFDTDSLGVTAGRTLKFYLWGTK